MLAKILTFEKFDKISHYCSSKRELYTEIVNKISNYLDSFCESYIFERNEQSNQFLTLNQVKKMLNYSDNRSVLNWCNANGVFVIHQGNAKTVNKVEFLLAFQKPLIEHLKRTHKNWQEKFLDYMNSNYINLLGKKTIQSSTKSYKAKTDIQQSFLTKIKEI